MEGYLQLLDGVISALAEIHNDHDLSASTESSGLRARNRDFLHEAEALVELGAFRNGPGGGNGCALMRKLNGYDDVVEQLQIVAWLAFEGPSGLIGRQNCPGLEHSHRHDANAAGAGLCRHDDIIREWQDLSDWLAGIASLEKRLQGVSIIVRFAQRMRR